MSDPLQITVEIVRVWVPVIGALSLFWRIYRGTKDSITKWMDTLLDNHLAHVQESLDTLCSLQVEQNDFLKKIAEK